MTDNTLLFELSWEVCNKVGGIYTVLISKAKLMFENFNNYFLIGPYFSEKAKYEFKEESPDEEINKIFEVLNKEGIVCYYGSWLVKGNPKVILIDFKNYIKNKNKIKTDLWDNFKVDSLFSNWDFEEPLIWATAASRLVELFYNLNKYKVILHCHEWLSGFALLDTKMKNLNIATIFTTHATMLGRTLSSSGIDLYNNLEKLDPEKEAEKYKIVDKFTTEKACTVNSDIFTTVSEITSIEAEHFFNRKADILLLNGLDSDSFPSFEETSLEHINNREKIREFISYYFFPYYHFDLEQTLNFFIVGRYEFKNKGIDIFIKALSNLNNIMKEENSKKTVIVFLWIPTQAKSAKISIAKNKASFHLLKHFIQQNSEKLNRRVMENLLKCVGDNCLIEQKIANHSIFDEEFFEESRKLRLNFSREGNPPLVTHNIQNEENDEILKSLKENNLDNKEEDKVKIVFYPLYLTGVDGLLDLEYYKAISGCHLGLFPSYYEPWGYTPLESTAWGVPSLTTDLGGFGRFLISKNKTDEGVFVLKRFRKSEEEVINDFTKILHDFTNLDRKGRVDQKLIAKSISKLADWKIFIKNYFEAYELALKKRGM
ncbi:glycogen/starch synthase [Candidatus Woesearchaeota archaeon]|nr:glycogen/starch synthase [Candidatus Woesearchaeota archaeon]